MQELEADGSELDDYVVCKIYKNVNKEFDDPDLIPTENEHPVYKKVKRSGGCYNVKEEEQQQYQHPLVLSNQTTLSTGACMEHYPHPDGAPMSSFLPDFYPGSGMPHPRSFRQPSGFFLPSFPPVAGMQITSPPATMYYPYQSRLEMLPPATHNNWYPRLPNPHPDGAPRSFRLPLPPVAGMHTYSQLTPPPATTYYPHGTSSAAVPPATCNFCPLRAPQTFSFSPNFHPDPGTLQPTPPQPTMYYPHGRSSAVVPTATYNDRLLLRNPAHSVAGTHTFAQPVTRPPATMDYLQRSSRQIRSQHLSKRM